jgi:alpha-galactosidase
MTMRKILRVAFVLGLTQLNCPLYAQTFQNSVEEAVLSNGYLKISVNKHTGTVNYVFKNGIHADHTVAYVNDIHSGSFASTDFGSHVASVARVRDSFRTGVRLTVVHSDDKHSIQLVQHFTVYKSSAWVIINCVAISRDKHLPVETRDISPLAVLPDHGGKLVIPGMEPRILDAPFDNDDWVSMLERKWPDADSAKASGISYEFSAVYNQSDFSGLVIGSIRHDVWKTGIVYRTGLHPGTIDSLKVFGGAATPDNPSLPAAYGGYDGTHDVVAHGTMTGKSVSSSDIYLNGSNDIRKAFVEYGRVNTVLNGCLTWKGYAPVYWNSYAVEGVLGSSGIMMPPAVEETSDFIGSLHNFSRYAKPVISIDSYDQRIYSTEVLKSLGEYAKKNGQQMGFYFIPFALWTWKDNFEGKKLQGTDYLISDVLLRDSDHHPILYKDGKFCAYAMDPTHPAIRQYIIYQLKKAKAINAKFLKIDFLTAGALETSVRYDPSIRTGMQAYNKGMRELKLLIDSIMGKDVFITQAISPMFPNQYAHTRFVSTDVYSHLRDDEPGFPHYGSTEASLATGSHMGWVQGTLFPFTNLDVSLMKNFQRNPDLTEQEIKVRIYAMMVMGSILGDGSDFRNSLAANRAKKILDNQQVCRYFSHPEAFTPLQFADGDTFEQQMSFYLPGKKAFVALFNFDRKKGFLQNFSRESLHLNKHTKYIIKDFLTDKKIGELKRESAELTLNSGPADALMVGLVAVN